MGSIWLMIKFKKLEKPYFNTDMIQREHTALIINRMAQAI